MKYGNYFNPGRPNGEIHGIRESLEQAAPDSRINFGKLKRIDPHTRQNVIHLIEKANPQTRFLVLVPARCVGDIKLGLRSEKQSSHRPWDRRLPSLFRVSSRTSSQSRPSEGLVS